MATRDKTPWDRTFDPTPDSIDSAIVAAGLDWQVLPKPAMYLNAARDETDEYIDLADYNPENLDLVYEVEPVPNHFVNVRSDNGQPLGVVTTRYSAFHNIQAFAWLSHIFGTEMEFVSAGDFMNSRRVWVLMRLPSYIEVAGDKIGQYAFVHTSHDGKHSVTASMTPYLVRSATLMTTELRRARNFNAKRTIAIRHTGNMEDKVAQAEEAQRVLGVSINYYEQFADLGRKLAKKKASKKDAQTFVETLLPINEDKMGDRAQANQQIARDQVLTIASAHESAPDSWWALYTAASEFADWVRPERKKDGRFQRAIDDPDGFKNQAFELALGGAEL